MPIYSVSVELVLAGKIRCAHCWDRNATHIELSATRMHLPEEHLVLCKECAYLAGLKNCQKCDTEPKVLVSTDGNSVELVPVYAPEILFGDDVCAVHLVRNLQPGVASKLNFRAG